MVGPINSATPGCAITKSSEKKEAMGESNDSSLLSDPLLDILSTGDPIEQIAALMTRSFRQDRNNASKLAALEEKDIMAEGRKRVEAMRDKADAVRNEAYTKGMTQIASGAFKLQSCEASAKATESLGTMWAGHYSGKQGDLEADAVHHETLQKAAERRQEEYRDQLRDARETLDRIADFLHEAKTANNDASKAAIFRA